MSRIILVVIGILYAGAAAYMWFEPKAWYENTPGVAAVGAFNLHFIRDLALAFFVSSFGFFWAVYANNRTAAFMGAFWPCLHALVHIWVWLMRGVPLDTVAFVNFFGIQAPAWIALIAAWHLNDKGAQT